MRTWLSARKAGIEVVPNPDDPTSVLRPSRATTVGEKQEMKKRKAQVRPHFKVSPTSVGEDLGQRGCTVGLALAVVRARLA
jgi:hypothetical protein